MAAILMAVTLSGCGSTLTDLPIVGEPAEVPRATGDTSAYLAVHDVPAPRSEPVMSSADQARVQNDLVSARDRQAATAKADADRDAQENQANQQAAQKAAAKSTKTVAKATAKTAKPAKSDTAATTQGNATPQ